MKNYFDVPKISGGKNGLKN